MALVAGAACGAAGPGGGSGPLTVLAAASLTEPFSEMGRRFEALHPGTGVELSFAASSTVAAQVLAGAPGDVVATADEPTMQRMVAAGAVGPPTVFARNRLALLVARDNPGGVGSVADLARPGVTFVQCAPEVPCGRLAAAALEAAGVAAPPASLEPNVSAVVSRVRLGEADAGLVYETDLARAGGGTTGVVLAPGTGPETSYLVAPLAGSRHPAAAAWIAFTVTGPGRAVLEAAGFGAP